MSICCFCGHRRDWEIDHRIKPDLQRYMEDLILRCHVDTFYSGGMGAFDHLCERIVRSLKQSHPSIRLCLIIPYLTKELQVRTAEIENEYDEILLPNAEGTFYKAAIGQRNRWMVLHSKYVIAYVTHDGGANQMLTFAQRQSIHIQNFAP